VRQGQFLAALPQRQRYPLDDADLVDVVPAAQRGDGGLDSHPVSLFTGQCKRPATEVAGRCGYCGLSVRPDDRV